MLKAFGVGPSTQDHIDIIMAGADKHINWLIPGNLMLLRISALPPKSLYYKKEY